LTHQSEKILHTFEFKKLDLVDTVVHQGVKIISYLKKIFIKNYVSVIIIIGFIFNAG